MFNGLLSIGGLLMFGNIDAILRYNPDFLVDYMEIPGTSIHDAITRYTYRMPEQRKPLGILQGDTPTIKVEVG